MDSCKLLTWVEVFQFLGQCSHILLELYAFLLFVVVLRERLKVNLRHLLVLAVEFIQFKHRIRLALWVWGVVTELVSFAVLLNAHLVALLSAPKVEGLAAIDSYR